MVKLFRKFYRDERGLSLTEALLTLPIILIMMAAMVEFGFVIYQWNQTAKAMQLGARLLAVSDPVVSKASFSLLSTYSDAPEPGSPIPAEVIGDMVSCGAGTGIACRAAGADGWDGSIDRLITGGDGVCNASYGTVSGMCDFNPRISQDNVRVTYTRTGLGYVGRPGHPVVTVTVELVGLRFNLPLIGALIRWASGGTFTGFDVPANPVTVTSEDLDSNG